MRPATLAAFASLRVDPFEHLGEGPDDAAGCQVKAQGCGMGVDRSSTHAPATAGKAGKTGRGVVSLGMV
jgi:hypothetical protein